jgi:hypothetical protein
LALTRLDSSAGDIVDVYLPQLGGFEEVLIDLELSGVLDEDDVERAARRILEKRNSDNACRAREP